MSRTNRTILFVSVETTTLPPLVAALGQSSYQVRTAASAEAALVIMCAETVDLAIVDCLNDYQRCKELLQSCHNLQPFCKIILLKDKGFDKDKTLSSVVHEWCQKPVDKANLLEKVHSLIDDKTTAIFIDRMTDQSVKYSLSEDEDSDSAKLYARFLETFRVGVCLADEDGIVEYINKKGYELLGFNSGEKIVGAPIADIFRIADDRDAFLHNYLKRDWTPRPLKAICLDGNYHTMQANITFSESNPPRVVTVFFRRP